MDNRYNKFEIFMVDVVNEANKVYPLDKLFKIQSNDILENCIRLIKVGWWAMLGITSLVCLGPLAIGIATSSFLLSPLGVSIAIALGSSAYYVIKFFYKYKAIPLAIKDIGNTYKSQWEAADNDQEKIDDLFKLAVCDLLRKCPYDLPLKVTMYIMGF